MLDLFLPDSILNSQSNDGHQFGWFDRGASSRFRLFPHMRNLDALEHRLDAVIHLAQRLADVAPIALATLPANGDTRRDKQRTVDGLDHFESRNRMRRPRQPVPTVGAVLRMQQSS